MKKLLETMFVIRLSQMMTTNTAAFCDDQHNYSTITGTLTNQVRSDLFVIVAVIAIVVAAVMRKLS